MKIAYLVVAHRNPKLLARLIGKLSLKSCRFFIHIDAKSNIAEFSEVRGENVFFIEHRIPVYWGEFSQVKAIVSLLRLAFQDTNIFDYFILLQGSDYPLRNGDYIRGFLQANRGLEFMNIVKMPNEAAGKPISRINTLSVPSCKPIRRLVIRTLVKFGLAKRDYRKYLHDLEPYSGSASWALSRDACKYTLDFMDHNQYAEQYFQNTLAPDEMFFHTILGNSLFRSRIRRNLLYEDWSARGSHPAMIDDQHIAAFEVQDKVMVSDVYGPGEALFIRKLSDDRLDLLKRIDDRIVRGRDDPEAPQ